MNVVKIPGQVGGALLRETSLRSPLGLPVVMTLALALGIASVAVQGFVFGVFNNVYHIPFVLRLPRDPLFASDPFYQSLRFYASGVWVVLRSIASERNVEALFLACHIASRVMTFLAILVALRSMGMRTPLAMVFGGVAVLAWPMIYGYSPVGQHGEFTPYFDHTELTWPAVILTLVCLQRRWLLGAAVLVGVSLCINLFVGVWMSAVLLWAIVSSRNLFSKRMVVASLGASFLVASPVLVWSLRALGSSGQDPVSVSFREYVRAFWPYHFLIGSAAKVQVVRVAIIFGAAGVCLQQLGLKVWRDAIGVLAGVFAVGAVLPYVLDNRVVFNLHLLRVDGVALFMLPIAAAALAWHDLSGAKVGDRVRGLALAAALFGGWPLAALAGVVVLPRATRRTRIALVLAGAFLTVGLAAHLWPAMQVVDPVRGASALLPVAALVAWPVLKASQRQQMACVLLLLAIVFVAVGWEVSVRVAASAGLVLIVMAVSARHEAALAGPAVAMATLAVAVIGVISFVGEGTLEKARQYEVSVSAPQIEWNQLLAWVRQHRTEVRGPVLVPLASFGPAPRRDFQLWARVPVWVDWSQGAAVMWYPPFFDTWYPRYVEVRALRAPNEFVAYARSRGLSYYVGIGAPCGKGSLPAVVEGEFALCRVGS